MDGEIHLFYRIMLKHFIKDLFLTRSLAKEQHLQVLKATACVGFWKQPRLNNFIDKVKSGDTYHDNRDEDFELISLQKNALQKPRHLLRFVLSSPVCIAIPQFC